MWVGQRLRTKTSESSWTHCFPPPHPIPQQVQTSLPPQGSGYLEATSSAAPPPQVQCSSNHVLLHLDWQPPPNWCPTPRAFPAPTQGPAQACTAYGLCPGSGLSLSSPELCPFEQPDWLLLQQLLYLLYLLPVVFFPQDLCLVVSSSFGAILMILAKLSRPLLLNWPMASTLAAPPIVSIPSPAFSSS